jgi:hypothetical protein
MVAEEMRRNLAYGQHARQQWLAHAQSTRDTAADLDPLVREGKVAFALEHAAYETARAATLIKKWTPVLQRAASSPLLRDDMHDILEAAGLLTKGEGRADELVEEENEGPLVLHIQELQGLAMATDDHVDEPGYIPLVLTFASLMLTSFV